MIVDSTRKGKRFPDSMSKTIPIWTCVLNRAILNYRNKMNGINKPKEEGTSSSQSCGTAVQESLEWDPSLHLPLWVPDTEKIRIDSKLNEWVKVLETSGVDIASISSLLKKPLRPLWISQKTVIWLNEVPDYNDWDFTPIILISASASSDIYRQKTSSEFSWNYIAGAGDDEESWARGLTPILFWNNVYDIISSGPDVCNQTVANIVEKDRVFRSQRGQNAPQVSVKPKKSERTWSNQSQDQPLDIIVAKGISGDLLDSEHGVYWLGLTNLAVCSTKYNFKSSNVDSILNCDKNQILCTLEDSEAYLHLPVMDSKFDRFSLQRNLPSALNFAELHLKKGKRLAVCCNSGEDISVCICLAILISLFNVEGAYDDGKFFKKARVTKLDMCQRLVFVCKYIVNARPSRGSIEIISHSGSGVDSVDLKKIQWPEFTRFESPRYIQKVNLNFGKDSTRDDLAKDVEGWFAIITASLFPFEVINRGLAYELRCEEICLDLALAYACRRVLPWIVLQTFLI
ncbi:hypothetical protein R6Q59_016446 [Mikania micrantha]